MWFTAEAARSPWAVLVLLVVIFSLLYTLIDVAGVLWTVLHQNARAPLVDPDPCPFPPPHFHPGHLGALPRPYVVTSDLDGEIRLDHPDLDALIHTIARQEAEKLVAEARAQDELVRRTMNLRRLRIDDP